MSGSQPALNAMVIVVAPGFVPTAVAQGINGVAGAAIAPAIAGITLGLVEQAGYAHQVGRNEAFNHAGNVVAALLAGGLGYFFGIGAMFVVMAGMALASLMATWFIDPEKIDHRAARGLPDKERDGHASGWSTLVASKPLLRPSPAQQRRAALRRRHPEFAPAPARVGLRRGRLRRNTAASHKGDCASPFANGIMPHRH